MAAWPTITDGVTLLAKSVFDSIKSYIDGVTTLTFSNTGLKVSDTDASHALTIAPGSNLTADRTLTVTTGDAARTLTLSGNATLNQDVSSTGTPTFSTVTSGAGSVTVPALTTTGDTNTGVYYPAADTVAVTTGGTERWRITSAGHLITGADNTYDVGASGATRPRNVYVAGTAAIASDTTIGGTTTRGRLTVDGGQSGTATSSAAFRTPGSAQGEKADLALYSTFVGTADNGVRRSADILSGFNGGAWGNEFLALHVGSGGSANDTAALTTERLRIDGSGNVGIATTSPGSKLQVNGDVTIGGGASASLLKFLEPSGSGTNYTAFKAQAQTGDVTYTLPAADGTSGQVLSTNGSGTLSWVAAGGASVLSKSANYTVQTSDGSNVVVLCTNTITITLYAASGNSGKIINVKNNGTGTITIDANASELIDGALTQVIPTQYVSLSLVCDGTGWAII